MEFNLISSSQQDSPDQRLVNLLSVLLSPDNNQRNSAEKELRNQKLSNMSFLIDQLLLILKAPTIRIEIKKMSTIILKNTLLDSQETWLTLPLGEQINIKTKLTQMITPIAEVETMKEAALILSSIAYIELTHTNPTQIKQLIEGITTQSNCPKVTSVYLFAIKIFFEHYKIIQSIDRALIQPILSQLYSNLSTSRCFDIIILTLEVIILILPFIRNNIANIKENILQAILTLINGSDNIEITSKALLALYEVIMYYHQDIPPFAEVLVNALILLLFKSNEKEVNLSSINIFCLICEKETLIQTALTKQLLEQTKKIASLLITAIESNVKPILDEDDWSIPRASCYFLSYLIQIQLDSSLIEMLFIYVSNNFYAISETKQFISLLVLSSCLETNHKEALSTLLLPNMTNIWAKINYKNNVFFSISLSWLLGKISELLPNVFERKTFHELIPTLINYIDSENQNIITRINLSIAFGNIIRYYGDENTSQNKNSFSSYYKVFVDKFIDLACNVNTIKSGLSFYLLRIVMNVVHYSSMEYQDQLELLLIKVLSKFEICVENNQGNNPLCKELQFNLCLIIHQIFNKIIRRVDKSLCKTLYNAIIASFQQNEPYESGILCLFNIVIIIDNDIELFFNYLFQCFTLKDNYLLIQGAVATISNLAWNKNNTLKHYSSPIMQALFSLLTDENIKFAIKPLAISAIGDICFNYPSIIFEHIQSIIPLLFSTFEVVIATKDDDYMIILKNSIECFSMVLFSLQETQREQMIFMSIKQLIGYIIYFSSFENNDINTHLIMLFGDLINLLGERIREFTNKEQVRLIQGKLQVNASDNSVKWMNSIINKIFH